MNSGSLDTPGIFSQFQNIEDSLIITPALDTLAQSSRFIVSYQRQDLNVPLNVEYQEVVNSGVNTQIVKDLPIPGVKYTVTVWSVRDYQYSPHPVTSQSIIMFEQGKFIALTSNTTDTIHQATHLTMYV